MVASGGPGNLLALWECSISWPGGGGHTDMHWPLVKIHGPVHLRPVHFTVYKFTSIFKKKWKTGLPGPSLKEDTLSLKEIWVNKNSRKTGGSAAHYWRFAALVCMGPSVGLRCPYEWVWAPSSSLLNHCFVSGSLVNTGRAIYPCQGTCPNLVNSSIGMRPRWCNTWRYVPLCGSRKEIHLDYLSGSRWCNAVAEKGGDRHCDPFSKKTRSPRVHQGTNHIRMWNLGLRRHTLTPLFRIQLAARGLSGCFSTGLG